MKTQHEKAHVLHQEGDEAEEDPGADGDESVGPHGQDVLLQADQVDDQGPEDETRQEHGSFEASVSKKGAKDAKEEVKHANGSCHNVVRFMAETKKKSCFYAN